MFLGAFWHVIVFDRNRVGEEIKSNCFKATMKKLFKKEKFFSNHFYRRRHFVCHPLKAYRLFVNPYFQAGSSWLQNQITNVTKLTIGYKKWQ